MGVGCHPSPSFGGFNDKNTTKYQIMETTEQEKPKSKRGGPRPGSGRPRKEFARALTVRLSHEADAALACYEGKAIVERARAMGIVK